MATSAGTVATTSRGDLDAPDTTIPIAVGVGVGAPSLVLVIVGAVCCFSRRKSAQAAPTKPARETEMVSTVSERQSGEYEQVPPIVREPSIDYSQLNLKPETLYADGGLTTMNLN